MTFDLGLYAVDRHLTALYSVGYFVPNFAVHTLFEHDLPTAAGLSVLRGNHGAVSHPPGTTLLRIGVHEDTGDVVRYREELRPRAVPLDLGTPHFPGMPYAERAWADDWQARHDHALDLPPPRCCQPGAP